MSDNEIVKALECCIEQTNCRECPLYKGHSSECLETACKNALDLINRLQAEKEALIAGQETLQKYIAEQKAEIERLKTEKDNLIRTYAECQAEAVKEFAERLKEKILETEDETCFGGWEFSTDEIISISNNLLKEMVGDK